MHPGFYLLFFLYAIISSHNARAKLTTLVLQLGQQELNWLVCVKDALYNFL